MVTYVNFFSLELFNEIYEYAKQCTYRRIEDNIYNFKGADIKGKLKNHIEYAFRQHNLVGEPSILRVQKIDPKVKVTANYHKHRSIYKENVVCFLNSGFTGGEFEYIDNDNPVQITSQPNTAIVFGPTLRHRVLPVTEGVRYTLVAFLAENSYLNKQDRTLI